MNMKTVRRYAAFACVRVSFELHYLAQRLDQPAAVAAMTILSAWEQKRMMETQLQQETDIMRNGDTRLSRN